MLNFTKKIKKLMVSSMLGLSLTACGPDVTDKKGPETELEILVKSINTPEEAQEFIEKKIKYVPNEEKDNQRYPQTKLETKRNGADVQSLATSLERKKGGLFDLAIVGASLLKDNNYGSEIVYIDVSGGTIVFYAYNKNGRYGSIGTNKINSRPAMFGSIEDLARTYSLFPAKKIMVYDFEHADLVNGTNEGLITKSPFIKYYKDENDIVKRWELDSVDDHLERETIEYQDRYEKKVYDKELFDKLVNVYETDKNIFTEIKTLERDDYSLLKETKSSQDGELILKETLTESYDDKERTTASVIYCEEEGYVPTYQMTTYEYGPGKRIVMEDRGSFDGDFIFDDLMRVVYPEGKNGPHTTYIDRDYDGVWDEVDYDD